MNAREAKKTAYNYNVKLQRDHEAEYKKMKAEEKKRILARWRERSPELIALIEGYIKKRRQKVIMAPMSLPELTRMEVQLFISKRLTNPSRKC